MGRILDCWLVFIQHGIQKDPPSHYLFPHATHCLPIYLMEAPILVPQPELKEYLVAAITWKGGKAMV